MTRRPVFNSALFSLFFKRRAGVAMVWPSRPNPICAAMPAHPSSQLVSASGAGFVSVCALFVFLVASPTTHADENFGYLFTTPAQRAVLDRMRLRDGGTVVEGTEALGALEPNTGRAPIKVDGVVSSSSGKTNAWINGAKPKDNQKFKTGAIKTGNVDVIVGPDGTRITLKPGQSYEPDSGKVRDTYQTGTPDQGAGKCRSSKNTDGEISIVCDGS